MSLPVLFIGGMDSSGGAGLMRDCTMARDCGVDARVAVTAVTAQSVTEVSAVHPVPPEVVAAQIAAAGPVAAVKIGMLGTTPIVEAVAAALPDVPCVIDPVLRSSSGRDLLDRDGLDLLLACLVPRATVITPNLPELAALADRLGLTARDERTCVDALLGRGCHAVLVKGGHSKHPDISEDRLYIGDAPPLSFAAPRIGMTLRGTGCQLASAIASYPLRRDNLPEAVAAAKSRVQSRFLVAAAARNPVG